MKATPKVTLEAEEWLNRCMSRQLQTLSAERDPSSDANEEPFTKLGKILTTQNSLLSAVFAFCSGQRRML